MSKATGAQPPEPKARPAGLVAHERKARTQPRPGLGHHRKSRRHDADDAVFRRPARTSAGGAAATRRRLDLVRHTSRPSTTCLVFIDAGAKAYLSITARAEVRHDHAKATEIWRALTTCGGADRTIRMSACLLCDRSRPWDEPAYAAVAGAKACGCGGAGMPCPSCNVSNEDNPPLLPGGFQPDESLDGD